MLLSAYLYSQCNESLSLPACRTNEARHCWISTGPPTGKMNMWSRETETTKCALQKKLVEDLHIDIATALTPSLFAFARGHQSGSDWNKLADMLRLQIKVYNFLPGSNITKAPFYMTCMIL